MRNNQPLQQKWSLHAATHCARAKIQGATAHTQPKSHVVSKTHRSLLWIPAHTLLSALLKSTNNGAVQACSSNTTGLLHRPTGPAAVAVPVQLLQEMLLHWSCSAAVDASTVTCVCALCRLFADHHKAGGVRSDARAVSQGHCRRAGGGRHGATL
jgi:hypothetical protein